MHWRLIITNRGKDYCLYLPIAMSVMERNFDFLKVLRSEIKNLRQFEVPNFVLFRVRI